jgi:two-component system, OmpR family, phosphate regulon sensor histidine kinase PhoR
MRADPETVRPHDPSALESALERALHAQFQELATIFDALQLIVYVADFDTHELLFVNRYTQQVFGEEWAGRRCWEFLQSDQTGPCAFCSNHRLIKDGVAQPPYVWEFRNTVNRRWYHCIDRAIPWQDGRLVRLEAAVDITERKEAELFRQQYVGLVSHDLRNPLGAIVLAARQLEHSLSANRMQHELVVLSRLTSSAKRIDTMIQELLESMRLESPGVVLHREQLDPGQLTERLLELLPPEQRARIDLRVREPRPSVSADASHIGRVLDNLISNALKYSASDAPVVVEIEPGPTDVTIAVSDRGEGIDAEHLPNLFDRFYRVPGTSAEGLGLGLYIARLIVEHHGGQIRVESQRGRGARFQFTLPRIH